MTTYGHFKLKEFEAGGGHLYFEQSGHWYRITETYAIRALDRLNYQAEEMSDHEVSVMLAERAKPVELEPAPEKPVLEPVLLDPTPRKFIRPEIYKWALEQPEYKGKGRVSNFLRQRYAKEFGLQAIPGQSTNATVLDEDE